MGCLAGAEQEQECSVANIFLNFKILSDARNSLTS